MNQGLPEDAEKAEFNSSSASLRYMNGKQVLVAEQWNGGMLKALVDKNKVERTKILWITK